MPPTLGRADAHRPYFEVLIVTGAPADTLAGSGHGVAPASPAAWMQFIYEPVVVGSFEDAFCATVLNPDLAAVIIHEGFPFRSRHDAPILRVAVEAAPTSNRERRGIWHCTWRKCSSAYARSSIFTSY